MSTARLVEHFFRHEYGRLVATLSRRVGVQHIEAVEDAVQSALMTALETWTRAGLPDNPSAWVFRVAHNNVVGELRQRSRRHRILDRSAQEEIETPEHGPEVLPLIFLRAPIDMKSRNQDRALAEPVAPLVVPRKWIPARQWSFPRST